MVIASLSTFLSWILTKMALRFGTARLVAAEVEPGYYLFWEAFLGMNTATANVVSTYKSETKSTCTLHAHAVVLLLLCGSCATYWSLGWILVAWFDFDVEELSTQAPENVWGTLLGEVMAKALRRSALSIKLSSAYLEGESGTAGTTQYTYHAKRRGKEFDVSELLRMRLSNQDTRISILRWQVVRSG